MNDRLTSRKFILAILAQAGNVALCWTGHIDAGVFATVTALTVGGYITGNVVQKATAKAAQAAGGPNP